MAFADIITNDVTSTAAGKVLTVEAGKSATVTYGVANTNSNNSTDPQNSCNPADGTALAIRAVVPNGVTAPERSVSECSSSAGSVIFSVGPSVAAGDYVISHVLTDAGTGTYVDNAGFTLRVTAPVVTDSTAPLITPTITGTLGQNGWYTSNVGVSWSVTDAESSISSSSGCGSTSITTDQNELTYTCTATSAGGKNSSSVTVKRDATAPTVTAGTPSGTPGLGGWYTSDVTVPFTASDGRSGLADTTRASFSVTSTGTGSAVSVASGQIADMAGNTASASASFAIDKTNPTIRAAMDKVAATSGWFNAATGAPTVSYSCAVGGSPLVGNCPTSHNFAEGEDQTHSGTIGSASGRSATAGVSNVDVDLTAPAISRSDVNNTTWRKTDLVESFTTDDTLSGLASAADGLFDLTASAESASATVPTTVSKTVHDAAGNSSTRTVSALIDRTAPEVVAAPDNETWSKAASVQSGDFTASDVLSGIADADKTFRLTATAESTKVEGVVQSTVVTRDVTDRAGNTTKASFSALIDRTAPVAGFSATSPVAGETYWSTQVPTAECASTDVLSGLAATGGCVITSSVNGGSHTVTVTATDKAGNTHAVSRTYTVRDLTHTGFYSPVEMTAGVVNTVKGGSTVPLKFNLQIDRAQQDSTALVTGFTATRVTCATGATEDAVDFVTTGSTALRWDATGAQFIQNWKTPTGANTCYRATATLADGETISALFKLK